MPQKIMQKDIGAVLLSGGLSTRMGQDKAKLHPYGECKPNLLDRTHTILANHFEQIWVSCAQDKPRMGYSCLFDERAEIGPISGIYAGLNAASSIGLKAIMVLPCDLPLIDDHIIQMLLQARTAHRATSQKPYNLMTTFLHEASGNIEALISIYEIEALELFQRAINEGIRAPRLVILEDKRTYIPYTDNISNAFYNLNTAEQFALFKKQHS